MMLLKKICTVLGKATKVIRTQTHWVKLKIEVRR